MQAVMGCVREPREADPESYGRRRMRDKKTGALMFLTFMILIVVLILYWLGNRMAGGEPKDYSTYSRHYAMITAQGDEDFWNEVYESALAEGRERDVYVERFGANLAVDYDRGELLDMAVRASVDGIIVAGDEEEETTALIDEAVEQGIPVVTVQNDCIESRRQCFVGCNNYNIGQEYGRQILKMLPDGVGRVLVLMDESRTDSGQNLILLAIRETLEEALGNTDGMVVNLGDSGTAYASFTSGALGITVDTCSVDSSRDFSAEESIRDIFLGEELPDVLVCLNAVHTRCAYSAAVDYNKVGTVQMIGYYDSDTILDAVSKNIVQATVAPDTSQMGKLSVEALDEYVETGYTNGYMAVDIHVITPDEAEELMKLP